METPGRVAPRRHTLGGKGAVPRPATHSPGKEDDLGGGPTIIRLELDIDDSIPAVVDGQVIAELGPSLLPGPLLLNHNLVVLDLIGDVAKVVRGLLELELVERSGHFIRRLHTGRLEGGGRTRTGGHHKATAQDLSGMIEGPFYWVIKRTALRERQGKGGQLTMLLGFGDKEVGEVGKGWTTSRPAFHHKAQTGCTPP